MSICAAPLVSVIIPVHNREGMIERAIRSVLAQTIQAVEVIVVDDASTDRSAQVASVIGDERVKVYVHETNRGAGAARNTGTRHARGQYVAYLDSDNEWLPTKLEAQLSVFETSNVPNLGSVTCDILVVDGSRTTQISVRPKGNVYEEALALNGHLGTGIHLVRRRHIAEIGMWDEQLVASEDRDFSIRLSQRFAFDHTGKPGLIIPRHAGPHVSVPSRKVVGRRMIVEKYRTELAARPRALARHLFVIAVLEIGLLEWEKARSHIFEAVRVWPWSWRRNAIALFALFGVRGIRAGFAIFR